MSTWRSVLWAGLLALPTACGSSGGGGDDLVFANSSGAEVMVAATLPDGSMVNVTLPQSSMAGETAIGVSFVAGETYSFSFSAGGAIAPTSITCTVAAAAETSGVASVLVFLNVAVGGLTAQCLTNWVESPV